MKKQLALELLPFSNVGHIFFTSIKQLLPINQKKLKVSIISSDEKFQIWATVRELISKDVDSNERLNQSILKENILVLLQINDKKNLTRHYLKLLFLFDQLKKMIEDYSHFIPMFEKFRDKDALFELKIYQ